MSGRKSKQKRRILMLKAASLGMIEGDNRAEWRRSLAGAIKSLQRKSRR